MGPTKKKEHNKALEFRRTAEEEFSFFLVFILLVFFPRFTKVLYATRATRGYQKHRISPKNSGKYSENPKF